MSNGTAIILEKWSSDLRQIDGSVYIDVNIL